MLFIFSTSVLIRHQWQFKTVVFPPWCLICALLSSSNPLSFNNYTIMNLDLVINIACRLTLSTLTFFKACDASLNYNLL